MGLFGKKSLTEIEVAGQFVLAVAEGVHQQWPEIVNELKRTLQPEDPISDDRYAGFEFSLAVIAVEIQALPDLLPSDQASRIREFVMQCLSSPDLGSYPREAIQEYQDAWNQSLQQGELPFCGIASVLFDKLECRNTVQLGGSLFKDPLLLMALGEKVVTCAGGWWKTVTQEYKLVP
jgi:hypothetical protein